MCVLCMRSGGELDLLMCALERYVEPCKKRMDIWKLVG